MVKFEVRAMSWREVGVDRLDVAKFFRSVMKFRHAVSGKTVFTYLGAKLDSLTFILFLPTNLHLTSYGIQLWFKQSYSYL